ncbi:hypothetical protein PVAP13_5NG540986 [Panicum virgatum]|uniref:Uncharacterized protein n=1 Tax=Panicum virgatum TaxID=38727 RepID=A0A8T0S3S2_PANVG|nr:hypothetical protein PVAP13_5NG540986 [Panicum virgatum]
MAVEVVQFLVRKFVDSLAEEEAAAAAMATELPFIAQLNYMRAELEKAAISPDNADELRECLYELNDLLVECRMLTNRPHRRRRFFTQPDAWRFSKTKKRVAAVSRRVLQCVGNDSGGGAAASQEDGAGAAAVLDDGLARPQQDPRIRPAAHGARVPGVQGLRRREACRRRHRRHGRHREDRARAAPVQQPER